MDLLPWIQGTGLRLCLQHPSPLPFQFLLNLSLQMSISFSKGQAVVSSSRGFRHKELRTMPSTSFYSFTIKLPQPHPAHHHLSLPWKLSVNQLFIWPDYRYNQFQITPMSGRSLMILLQYKERFNEKKTNLLGTIFFVRDCS